MILNTLNICACACVYVCGICVGMCIHFLYVYVCHSVLDASESWKVVVVVVVVLIGIRSDVIENGRHKSKPCWQYSIYQLNLSVFVMHSRVISGFLFLMLKKNSL